MSNVKKNIIIVFSLISIILIILFMYLNNVSKTNNNNNNNDDIEINRNKETIFKDSSKLSKDGIKIMDLEIIKDGELLTANIIVKNTNDSDVEGIFIMLDFLDDNSNKITSVAKKIVDIIKKNDTYKFSIDLSGIDGLDKIKSVQFSNLETDRNNIEQKLTENVSK